MQLLIFSANNTKYEATEGPAHFFFTVLSEKGISWEDAQ